MPLTNTAIRNAKSGKKTCKLYDERGLYLEVSPNGGKWWRLKYRFGGKEKRLSLGVYPDVTLKMARERRDNARKLLADQLTDFQGRFHLVEGRYNRGTSNKYAKCQLTSDPNDPRRTQVKSPSRYISEAAEIASKLSQWYVYR